MSVNFYKEFARDNRDDPQVIDAFDRLEKTRYGEAVEIAPETRARLDAALSRMTQNPQFELLSAGFRLRLGTRFEQFVPRLFRDETTPGGKPTNLPSLDEVFAALDKNMEVYRLLAEANGDDQLIASIFVTARELVSVYYEMLHDAGFASVTLGGALFTGGSIRSGMEFGNAGAELARMIANAALRDAFFELDLPWENTSLFPQEPSMRVRHATFFPRKMAVANRSDYYVIGAGGYGTQEEKFYVLGLILNGSMMGKDVILLESTTDKDFWKPLIARLNILIDAGAVDPSVRDMIYFANDEDDQIRTAAYIDERKRRARAEGSDFDERYAVTHASQDAVHREMLAHDFGLIDEVFKPLDRRRTISVFGAEGSYGTKYAADGARLIAGLDRFADGANILVSAAGAFGDAAANAAKTMERGAYLSVERALDPVSNVETGERAGKVRLYTDPAHDAAMMYHSSAAVFYLGGINPEGARYELMTLMQTGQTAAYPIFFVGTPEEQSSFLEGARSMLGYGTIAKHDLEYDPTTGEGRFIFVQNADEVLKHLETSGFMKNEPIIQGKPHKERLPLEEDHRRLLAREFMKRGFTEEEASVAAKRAVDEFKLNPAVVLESAHARVRGYSKATAKALRRNEARLGPNAYTRIVAGTLATMNYPGWAEKIGLRRVPKQPTLKGRVYTAAKTATASGRDPAAAARQAVGPVDARQVKFALHPGMVHPSGAAFPAFPQSLKLPGRF